MSNHLTRSLSGAFTAALLSATAFAAHSKTANTKQSALVTLPSADAAKAPVVKNNWSDEVNYARDVAAAHGDKTYIVLDKKAGKIYLFNNGHLVLSESALSGASTQDQIPEAAYDKPIDKSTVEDDVTPAGRFTVTPQTTGSLGRTLDINEVYGKSWKISLHSTYLGNPSEHRAQRLASRDPDQSHISHGCINVSKETLAKMWAVIGHPHQSTPIYILPQDRAMTHGYIPMPEAPKPTVKLMHPVAPTSMMVPAAFITMTHADSMPQADATTAPAFSLATKIGNEPLLLAVAHMENASRVIHAACISHDMAKMCQTTTLNFRDNLFAAYAARKDKIALDGNVDWVLKHAQEIDPKISYDFTGFSDQANVTAPAAPAPAVVKTPTVAAVAVNAAPHINYDMSVISETVKTPASKAVESPAAVTPPAILGVHPIDLAYGVDVAPQSAPVAAAKAPIASTTAGTFRIAPQSVVPSYFGSTVAPIVIPGFTAPTKTPIDPALLRAAQGTPSTAVAAPASATPVQAQHIIRSVRVAPATNTTETPQISAARQSVVDAFVLKAKNFANAAQLYADSTNYFNIAAHKDADAAKFYANAAADDVRELQLDAQNKKNIATITSGDDKWAGNAWPFVDMVAFGILLSAVSATFTFASNGIRRVSDYASPRIKSAKENVSRFGHKFRVTNVISTIGGTIATTGVNYDRLKTNTKKMFAPVGNMISSATNVALWGIQVGYMGAKAMASSTTKSVTNFMAARGTQDDVSADNFRMNYHRGRKPTLADQPSVTNVADMLSVFAPESKITGDDAAAGDSLEATKRMVEETPEPYQTTLERPFDPPAFMEEQPMPPEQTTVVAQPPVPVAEPVAVPSGNAAPTNEVVRVDPKEPAIRFPLPAPQKITPIIPGVHGSADPVVTRKLPAPAGSAHDLPSTGRRSLSVRKEDKGDDIVAALALPTKLGFAGTVADHAAANANSHASGLMALVFAGLLARQLTRQEVTVDGHSGTRTSWGQAAMPVCSRVVKSAGHYALRQASNFGHYVATHKKEIAISFVVGGVARALTGYVIGGAISGAVVSVYGSYKRQENWKQKLLAGVSGAAIGAIGGKAAGYVMGLEPVQHAIAAVGSMFKSAAEMATNGIRHLHVPALFSGADAATAVHHAAIVPPVAPAAQSPIHANVAQAAKVKTIISQLKDQAVQMMKQHHYHDKVMTQVANMAQKAADLAQQNGIDTNRGAAKGMADIMARLAANGVKPSLG